MVNFAQLKKNRQANFDKLVQETEKLDSKQFTKDERFWQPTVDKSGSGYAVFRFLPEYGEEDTPYVRVFEHGFKGPTGQWYIENSLTTLGKPDPLSELNSKLWNSTEDDNHPNRKQARDQKRKLTFISNIYMISDPANPENNGKVFLYKYGKKIFDKLKAKMQPEFADEVKINPFDLWDGATFRLKISKVAGYRNYDKSDFDAAAPLFADDKKLEEVYNKMYPLAPFIDPSNFKDYNTLKARLDVVLGATSGKSSVASTFDEEDDETIPFETTSRNRKTEAKSHKTRDIAETDIEDDDAFMASLLAD